MIKLVGLKDKITILLLIYIFKYNLKESNVNWWKYIFLVMMIKKLSHSNFIIFLSLR